MTSELPVARGCSRVRGNRSRMSSRRREGRGGRPRLPELRDDIRLSCRCASTLPPFAESMSFSDNRTPGCASVYGMTPEHGMACSAVTAPRATALRESTEA
jgi:hypothetical protein